MAILGIPIQNSSTSTSTGSSNKRRRTEDGQTSNPILEEEEEQEEEEDEEDEEDEEVEEEEEDDDDDEDRINASIDRYFLECSICCEPLRPSLMLCLNGHVGCSSCYTKLGNKCPTCNLNALVRCIALEKLVESVQIPCKYKKFGCEESIPYHKKQEHVKNCAYGPSPCPIVNCAHKSLPGKLYKHFVKDHKFSQRNLSFNQQLKLSLNQSEYDLILLGPRNSLFLLVNKPVDKIGYAISLHSINGVPNQGCEDLPCKLTVWDVNSGEIVVQLKTKVGSVEGGEIYGPCLLVPFDFCESGEFELSVLVVKQDA